ncbi:maleylpyruvate isomerase N-terminal domain-containing protein [Amycolatopsis sp. NPDC004368]
MTTTALTRVQELQAEWARLAGTLDDTAVRAPSALPGWTRGHLLTHLARNADAVGNLLTWAATGTERPMYGPGTARDDDINAGASRTTAELRADMIASGERLVDLAASLPDAAWTAPVRGRLGQPITGADALTLRLAETTIHLVDLDAGHDFASACSRLGERLDDVIANMIRMYTATLPPIRLTDGTHTWTMSDGSGGLVSGTPGAVLAWVSGRGPGDALSGPVPELKSLI